MRAGRGWATRMAGRALGQRKGLSPAATMVSGIAVAARAALGRGQAHGGSLAWKGRASISATGQAFGLRGEMGIPPSRKNCRVWSCS